MHTADGQRFLFSVQIVNITYSDDIFSVSGTANSAGIFGDLGTEQNGFFVSMKKNPDHRYGPGLALIAV